MNANKIYPYQLFDSVSSCDTDEYGIIADDPVPITENNVQKMNNWLAKSLQKRGVKMFNGTLELTEEEENEALHDLNAQAAGSTGVVAQAAGVPINCTCNSTVQCTDATYDKAKDLFDKIVVRVYKNKSNKPDIAGDTLGILTQVYDILENEGLL